MSKSPVIYKNFLTLKECDNILEYALSNFRIDDRIVYSNWHARINEDKEYQKYIQNKIQDISPFKNFYVTWINLTEYENGRDLGLHYDERSNCTFTIPLTENYAGGNFIIEKKEYALKKGDCILFDGSALLHGVKPVVQGYRAALNIWIKQGNQNLF